MALVEIEDALLSQLAVPFKDQTAAVKKAAEFERMHAEIASGPNRRDLLHLLKKQYPTLVVPELDAAEPVNAEIAALKKEFADYRENQEKAAKEREEERRKEAANGTIATGRKWLREQGCDDEGVKAVEQIMQDNSLASYEIAFSHFARNQPKPETFTPSPYGGASLDWFTPKDDAPDHQLLVKDPVAFKNAEVRKFFQEKSEGRLNLAQ